MENNKKINVVVDWYDEKKGFGIARNNDVLLLLHSSYLNNRETKIKSQDIISCIPIVKNNIYHATKIELINNLDKNTEEMNNQYIKK